MPKPKLPREKEKPLQDAFLDLLRLMDINAWRTNSGLILIKEEGKKTRAVKQAPTGTPDIIGFLPNDTFHGPGGGGRMLGLEVKRPGERPTDDQVQTMRTMNARGAVAFWSDSIGKTQATLERLLQGARISMDERGGWEVM